MERDIEYYRPVDRIAVLALLLGLLSGTALAGPGLWGVPVVACAAGLWALSRIRRADGASAGRTTALAGIILAIFFGSSAVANVAIHRSLAQKQARVLADRWIQLVNEGAWQFAHQMTLHAGARASPRGPLDEYYTEKAAQSEYMDFLENQPIATLYDRTPKDKIVEIGLIQCALYRYRRHVSFLYELRSDGDEPLRFGLQVERFQDPETKLFNWRVQPFVPDVIPTESKSGHRLPPIEK